MSAITTVTELEALYRAPSERVRTKKRDRLDDGLRSVLALSPFVLLATSSAEGTCDVSPRGGPVGFVKALDDRRVVLPDLNGNNLVDSLRNIVVNGHAALLVIVPGQHETLRIDGRAHLTADAEVLDLFVEEVRRPTLAVVIEIENVFGHCAKAFRRGQLWDQTTWPQNTQSVVLAARYRQLDLDVSFDEYLAASQCAVDADLAEDQPI